METLAAFGFRLAGVEFPSIPPVRRVVFDSPDRSRQFRPPYGDSLDVGEAGFSVIG
jgi:hypothetical protein